MLKQPTTVNWVEKPGNPNFLIPVEVIGNDNNEPPPPPPVVKTEGEKSEMVEEEEEEEVIDKGMEAWVKHEKSIGDLLYQSMTPLYQFIGMIEAESGKTMWYRFSADKDMTRRMTPINWGSSSEDDFRLRNSHLGNEILNKLLPNSSFIDANVNRMNRQLWNWVTGQNLTRNEFNALPDWIWENITDPVFQFILSSATFGALILAANELKLPLKPLIASPEVNYMFAQFVAKKFVSPKSNAYPSGMQGQQMVYRISSGFNTSSMANGKWLMGCREWFKGVFLGNDGVLRVGTGAPGSYSQEKRIDSSPYSIAVQNARRQKEITRPPAPPGTQRILIQVNDEFGKIYGSFPIDVFSLNPLSMDEIRQKIYAEQEAFRGKQWTKFVYNGLPVFGPIAVRPGELISVE